MYEVISNPASPICRSAIHGELLLYEFGLPPRFSTANWNDWFHPGETLPRPDTPANLWGGTDGSWGSVPDLKPAWALTLPGTSYSTKAMRAAFRLPISGEKKKKRFLRLKYAVWSCGPDGNPHHPPSGAGELSCSSSFPQWVPHSITTWHFQQWSLQEACCRYSLLNTEKNSVTRPDWSYELFSSSCLKGLILVAYHQIQARHFARA